MNGWQAGNRSSTLSTIWIITAHQMSLSMWVWPVVALLWPVKCNDCLASGHSLGNPTYWDLWWPNCYGNYVKLKISVYVEATISLCGLCEYCKYYEEILNQYCTKVFNVALDPRGYFVNWCVKIYVKCPSIIINSIPIYMEWMECN